MTIIKPILNNIEIEIVEGAMCRDHVHLSLRIPPKYAVSKVMGTLKGKSSIQMFNNYPELRRVTGRDRARRIQVSS